MRSYINFWSQFVLKSLYKVRFPHFSKQFYTRINSEALERYSLTQVFFGGGGGGGLQVGMCIIRLFGCSVINVKICLYYSVTYMSTWSCL